MNLKLVAMASFSAVALAQFVGGVDSHCPPPIFTRFSRLPFAMLPPDPRSPDGKVSGTWPPQPRASCPPQIRREPFPELPQSFLHALLSAALPVCAVVLWQLRKPRSAPRSPQL